MLGATKLLVVVGVEVVAEVRVPVPVEVPALVLGLPGLGHTGAVPGHEAAAEAGAGPEDLEVCGAAVLEEVDPDFFEAWSQVDAARPKPSSVESTVVYNPASIYEQRGPIVGGRVEFVSAASRNPHLTHDAQGEPVALGKAREVAGAAEVDVALVFRTAHSRELPEEGSQPADAVGVLVVEHLEPWHTALGHPELGRAATLPAVVAAHVAHNALQPVASTPIAKLAEVGGVEVVVRPRVPVPVQRLAAIAALGPTVTSDAFHLPAMSAPGAELPQVGHVEVVLDASVPVPVQLHTTRRLLVQDAHVAALKVPPCPPTPELLPVVRVEVVAVARVPVPVEPPALVLPLSWGQVAAVAVQRQLADAETGPGPLDLEVSGPSVLEEVNTDTVPASAKVLGSAPPPGPMQPSVADNPAAVDPEVGAVVGGCVELVHAVARGEEHCREAHGEPVVLRPADEPPSVPGVKVPLAESDSLAGEATEEATKTPDRVVVRPVEKCVAWTATMNTPSLLLACNPAQTATKARTTPLNLEVGSTAVLKVVYTNGVGPGVEGDAATTATGTVETVVVDNLPSVDVEGRPIVRGRVERVRATSQDVNVPTNTQGKPVILGAAEEPTGGAEPNPLAPRVYRAGGTTTEKTTEAADAVGVFPILQAGVA